MFCRFHQRCNRFPFGEGGRFWNPQVCFGNLVEFLLLDKQRGTNCEVSFPLFLASQPP